MDGKGRGIHRVVRSRIADFSMDVQILSREHSAGGADAFAGGLREEGGRVERRWRRLPMFALCDAFHGCGLASEAWEGDDGLSRPRIPELAADGGRLKRRRSAPRPVVPE